MLVKIFKSKPNISNEYIHQGSPLKLTLSITDFNTLKERLGHDASNIWRLQQLSKPNMHQQHYHFCGSLMLKSLQFTQLRRATVISLKLIPISENPKHAPLKSNTQNTTYLSYHKTVEHFTN